MKTLLIFTFLTMTSNLFAASQNEQFYSMSFNTLDGKKYSFSDLKGKAVLIVNTASKCGFTPQLQELEALNKKYSKLGLVILGVPSNDFK